MAYYDVLIAAWNSSIQPPAGVIGTGLSSAQNTVTKLSNLNGWTVTGTVPTNLTVTGSQILNCVAWSEFSGLTAQQQNNVLNMCAVPGGLLGGSTNVGLIVSGMIVATFPSSGATIASLTALAKATTQSWAQANGYPYDSSRGNLNGNDLSAAGGLT